MIVHSGSTPIKVHLCITQLKAQGPSRTCNESKEEEEEEDLGSTAMIVQLGPMLPGPLSSEEGTTQSEEGTTESEEGTT